MRTFALFLLAVAILGCRSERLIQVPECEPDTDPTEICDGRDNNCNGQIDENVFVACSNECEAGRSVCTNGSWSACSARQPSAEVCDGKDNDCDGIVDNNIPTAPCYPTSLGVNDPALNNGACNFGKMKCVLGSMSCQGAILPQMETCNGVDDNCDGKADEGVNGGDLDLIIALDYSGSMADKIQALISITSSWATKYTNRPDFRIALVGIPRDDPQGDCRTTVMRNFTDPATFAAELATHPNANGGGIEPQLDAIYYAALPSNPLGLQWRTNSSRAIVVFTDEEPQTYGNPTVVTEQMAFTAATVNVLRVYVFTTESTSWRTWNPRPLVLPNNVLEAELDRVIEEAACRGM